MRAEQRQRKITSARLIARSHMSKHQAQGLTCALSCTPGVGGNNLHVSRADPNAASSLLASQQGLIAFTCKPFPALLIYYLGAFLVPEVKVKKKKKKDARAGFISSSTGTRAPRCLLGPVLPSTN